MPREVYQQTVLFWHLLITMTTPLWLRYMLPWRHPLLHTCSKKALPAPPGMQTPLRTQRARSGCGKERSNTPHKIGAEGRKKAEKGVVADLEQEVRWILSESEQRTTRIHSGRILRQ